MKNKGFTYIEVMISFSVFALMLIVVIKMNNAINFIMDMNNKTLQTIHIAQMEMENYKSGINNISDFFTRTGFEFTDQQTDEEGSVVSRTLEDSDVNGFYVRIEETAEDDDISEVIVIVGSSAADPDAFLLKSKMLKN